MLAISLPIFIPILLAIIPQAGMAQQRLPQLQMSDQEIRQFVDEMRQENPPMDIHAKFQGHTNSRDTRDQADNPWGKLKIQI
jgi:DNA-directed RNA polymerase specialized sigma54-like protein